MYDQDTLDEFRKNLKVGDYVAYLPAPYEGYEVVEIYERDGQRMLSLGVGDDWIADEAYPYKHPDIPPMLSTHIDITNANVTTHFSQYRVQRNIPRDESELDIPNEENVDRFDKLAADCVQRFNVIMETGKLVTQDTLEDMIDDAIADLIEMKWRLSLNCITMSFDPPKVPGID